jgi:hypothetical protein
VRPAPLLLLAAVLLAGCTQGEPSAQPTPTATTTLPPVEPVDPLSPRPAVESPAPSAAGQPTCSAASLTVQDADLLADQNQLQEVFAVRTSGPTCRLRGWPEVSLLGSDGAALTVAVRRTGTAEALTLSRATSLSFVLGTPRTNDCKDVSTLVVRLPGTNRAIRTSTTMQVCDGSLSVGPVQRSHDAEGSEH